MVDHTIVHFEIPANDVERLRRFYTELFGWKMIRMPGPMEFWIIETVPTDNKGAPIRRGVNGGMYRKERPEHIPINYIAVESVDEYCEKIEALGGRVIQPKEEVPGIGWQAWARDPEGNPFAIFQAK